MKIKLTYLIIFILSTLAAFTTNKSGVAVWQPEVVNTANGVLFTLLTWLTARILRINHTAFDILGISLALLFLSPGVSDFLRYPEDGFLELFSICIVPFFMSQYNRINSKDFRKGYALMFLMGTFCSYTHDGISIPLCASFLWLSYQQRKTFFMRACWPMVLGFLNGTILLLIMRRMAAEEVSYLQQISMQTVTGLELLWDTKIFIFTLLLTAYFCSTRRLLHRMYEMARQNQLITLCMIFSLCTIPFSPLGLEYSVTGACFFCTLWFLLLAKLLYTHYTQKIRKGESN